MVDQTQIAQVTALNAEYDHINTVAQMFARGNAQIVAVIIAPRFEIEEGMPEPENFPGSVMVRTNRIEYPPQLINGIKTQLLDRQKTVREELRKMGVTGLASV